MDAIVASTLDIFEDLVKLPDLETEQHLAFLEPRHNEALALVQSNDGSWRLKERMKTVSVALVLCLNVGVDPPDILKTQPCAKLECWFDPLSVTPQKAIEVIGAHLEKQYECWQSKARYKKCLDPTVEEVKKLCTSLRRNAKEDRVLFHYNGHGVPKPTQNGEIWVFNKNYTQYIPLAIHDLLQWMGAPSIYVFDCSCAGSIVDSFQEFARQQKRDFEIELKQFRAAQQQQQKQQQNVPLSVINNNQQQHDNNKQPAANDKTNNGADYATDLSGQCRDIDGANFATAAGVHSNININNITTTNGHIQMLKCPDYENSIQLAACAADQILPMNPDLPADLFTSCLTTPIKIALRWFIQQNYDKLLTKVNLDLVDKIPGSLTDRRTMLGEMNWIFTAITDTIAWNVLPIELFQRLFRQDLLVASLFRNFLLAERVMRTYNCTPVSRPKLPQTHHHPMWRAWDMVVDLCLSQLSDVLAERAPFRTSTFFAEQLTAFEVWLDLDHSSKRDPEQLPIVLQVLLSPVHRLRALDLLGRFLNLGPWAVNSALQLGIFPYVLKLLQSSARELRPFLVAIWAKILANDRSCQVDLVREGYHRYFLCILSDSTYDAHYRTMAAFVMTCLVRDCPPGQEAAFQGSLIAFCLEQINDSDPALRKWAAICLGCSWYNYEDARWCGVRDSAHEKLYALLDDSDPEVRAAAVYALGTFVNSSFERTDHANTIDHSIGMKLVFSSLYDSNVMVRHELVVALQYLILAFELQFIQLESCALEGERRREDESIAGTPPSLSSSRVHNSSGFLSPTMQINRQQHQTSKRSYEQAQAANHLHQSQQQQQPISLMPVSNILRVNSLNAIPLNFGSGSKIVSNVYHIIWKAMHTLAADPHPRIAGAAQIIIDEIRSRFLSSAMSNESLKESKSNSSLSEPSSPNATFSISDSPPLSSGSKFCAGTGGSSSLAAAGAAAKKSFDSASGPATSSTTVIINNGRHQQHQPGEAHDNKQVHVNISGAQYAHYAHIQDNTAQNNNGQHQTTFDQHNDAAAILPSNNINNNNGNYRPQQQPAIDKITRSANVAINSSRSNYHQQHHNSYGHKFSSSRDNNNAAASEDDNRSNISSHKPLVTSDFVDRCAQAFSAPNHSSSYFAGAATTCDDVSAGGSSQSAHHHHYHLNNHNHSHTTTNGGGAVVKDQQLRDWKMLKNLGYRNLCLRELLLADSSKFSDHLATFKCPHAPNLISLHPFEPIMVVAGKDEFSLFAIDGIATHAGGGGACCGGNSSVGGGYHHHNANNHHHHHHNHHHGHLPFNHHHNHHHHSPTSVVTSSSAAAATATSSAPSSYLLGTQTNCCSKTSRITSLQLVNPHDQTLVLTGTNEGAVRVWRAYQQDGVSFASQATPPQLVSAFFLMPELQPQRKGLGLVLVWEQSQSKIYASSDQNDVRVIKVWDANCESKVQEISTGAESGVSCLSSDGEHSIAAGFLDGSIRIYDTRLKRTDCKTFCYRKHTERVLNLHLFKPNEKHINLVSGDISGDVRFWDNRAPSSVKRVDVGQKMNAMNVHAHADLFACGLDTQEVKIYTLDGTSRAECVIKSNSDNFFTSQKLHKINTLSFHPLKALLAVGSGDGNVSIYSARQMPVRAS